MDKIFLFIQSAAHTDGFRFTTGPLAGCFGILVFRRQDGPLGFDCDAASEVLSALLHDAILLEKTRRPQWLPANSQATRVFLRRYAGSGVLSLTHAASELLGELGAM